MPSTVHGSAWGRLAATWVVAVAGCAIFADVDRTEIPHAGDGGTAGASGGASGNAGTGSAAGSTGTGGVAGSAGTGGAAGSGGTGGVAGSGGSSGSTCTGGSGGAAGGATGGPWCTTGLDLHEDLTLANYPHVDGSTSNLPLARVIACELLGVSYTWMPNMGSEGEAEIVPVAKTPDQEALAQGIKSQIVHNKTHQAYLNLIDRTADLILVANKPSPDEAAYACNAGVTLDARPVALDALVVVVNQSNSVKGLTTQQIREIFLGKITNWGQVGGALAPIMPYVRPENSGSQQLFESIVMGGQKLPSWPLDQTPTFMGALIDHIKSDPFAIGYSVYYWVTYQYPSDGYRSLAVDGKSPNSATIASGAYPFTAPVWVVTRADLDSGCLAYQLRDWLLTADGQVVVAKSGYVPAKSP